MSKDKKLYMTFPSEKDLERRAKIINILLVGIPLVQFIVFEILARNGYHPVDGVVHGFFYGYSFLWTSICTTVLYLSFVGVIRLVYFALGYDVPDNDVLYKKKLNPKQDCTDAMVQKNNFSMVGMISFGTSAILLVLFLVQWALGSLWNWTPIAILLPIAVATPVILIFVTRRYNRKKKLEVNEIMDRLKGEH